MTKIKLPFVTIEYKEPITYLRFEENVLLDAQKVKVTGDACLEITGGARYLMLTDATGTLDVTPEGRKTAAESKNSGNIIAHAVIVKRLGQRLIANVYEEVNKPSYPVKVFTEEEEAITWLLEQKR